MDKIDWIPGQEGKGVVDKYGNVHAFDTDEYEVHDYYVQDHPDIGSPVAYFYIEPDGGIDVSSPSAGYDPQGHQAMMNKICEADPHFHPTKASNWDF